MDNRSSLNTDNLDRLMEDQEITSKATTSTMRIKAAIRDLHKAIMAAMIRRTNIIRKIALHRKTTTIKVRPSQLTISNSLISTISLSTVGHLHLNTISGISTEALQLDTLSLSTIKVILQRLNIGINSMTGRICHHKDSMAHLLANTLQAQAKWSRIVV